MKRPNQKRMNQQRQNKRKFNKQIHQETTAAANLKFRPLERRIGAEQRASQQRTKDLGNWFGEYLQTVNQGQAQTDAAYAQAAQTGQDFINQASARDTANTQATTAEANKSAAERGVTASTAPQETAAANQAQRNYLSAAYGQKVAGDRANQFGYLNEQKRIGVGQSIASRQQEQRRTRTIENDRKETARERGNFATTYQSELKEKAKNRALEKYKTNLAFKGEKATNAQKAAEAAAERSRYERENAEDNRTSENNNRRTNRPEPGGGGSKFHEGVQNATSRAKGLIQQAGWPKSKAAEAELIEKVEGTEGVGPREARRAVKQLVKRHNSTPGANTGPAQGGVHR